MNEENINEPKKKGPLHWFDSRVKKIIPNFNYRAILYLSVIFAVAMYVEIWRISSPVPKPPPPEIKKETVIADQSYWDGQAYKDKITNQTVDSFARETSNWLNDADKELVKRKFEDV